ncbi:Hydroxylysine kinase [Orchesella cincta]|uniref:Hydroxylysine kinase n=1 Tax=Orchesella cincta TaxID=48709 RepID=A0A1D2NHU1_ORCCI|nr:Hydroxylysine kinase [Orchesella cincta]
MSPSGDTGSTNLQPGQRIKPNVTLSVAQTLVEKHYGLQLESIKELNSYDDNNFYVKAKLPDGKTEKYTFKVLNSMDSKNPGHIEAEHAAMFLLNEKGVKSPVPMKTVEGSTFLLVTIENECTDSSSLSTRTNHIIRLLTFIEGQVMHEVQPTLKLLEKTGKYIAEIDEILKEVACAALDNHTSVWMLAHVLELEKFLYVIDNQPERLKLVSSVLAAYENRVFPIISQLEKGVQHGDFNEHNIIVQPLATDPSEYYIYGLIDFGDLQSGAYVFELAVTICYMMLECVKDGVDLDPFVGAQSVLQGYSSVRNVPVNELEILRISVASRLCQSLVLGAYTYSLDPGNEYLLTTAKTGWALLDRLWNEKSDEEMLACWKEAVCNKNIN